MKQILCIKKMLLTTVAFGAFAQPLFAGREADRQKLRKEGSCHSCDLSGFDLRDDIIEANKIMGSRGINLCNSNLEGSIVSGSNLSRSNLIRTNQRNIVAIDTNFVESEFTSSDCTNGNYEGANFMYSKLYNYSTPMFQPTVFDGANIKYANFRYARGFGTGKTSLVGVKNAWFANWSKTPYESYKNWKIALFGLWAIE